MALCNCKPNKNHRKMMGMPTKTTETQGPRPHLGMACHKGAPAGFAAGLRKLTTIQGYYGPPCCLQKELFLPEAAQALQDARMRPANWSTTGPSHGNPALKCTMYVLINDFRSELGDRARKPNTYTLVFVLKGQVQLPKPVRRSVGFRPPLLRPGGRPAR